jgi:hypothetical protein
MTPKGANLEATDLLEISEVSGTGYITKSITGQEIINAASGGGGSQDLQQVTDIGATTTNAIQITHSGSTDTLTATHSSGSGIGLLITKGGANEGLKVNKTSGSGNAATIIGTLEATTLVKTGGLATEFLMADGSTNTSVVPTTRNITINGTTQDLSADRSYNVENIMYGNLSNAIAVGLTRYYGFSDLQNTNSELLRRIILPRACTFSKFYILTSNVQPITGSYVITILKNGFATSITVTIPAGSLAGQYTDLVNSVSFAAGDGISIEVVNNALANSANIVSVSIVYV